MTIKKKENQKIGEIIYSGKNVFMGYSSSKNDLNKKSNKKKDIKNWRFCLEG